MTSQFLNIHEGTSLVLWIFMKWRHGYYENSWGDVMGNLNSHKMTSWDFEYSWGGVMVYEYSWGDVMGRPMKIHEVTSWVLIIHKMMWWVFWIFMRLRHGIMNIHIPWSHLMNIHYIMTSHDYLLYHDVSY